jgi:hypothetical protein
MAFNNMISHDTSTDLLEFKPGPYEPLTDKDFAQWAPPEGDESCPRFVSWYTNAAIGDIPPML